MTEPTDNDLDALILQHWPAAATATLPLRWIRAAFREGLAKWGAPAPVGVEPLIPFGHGCKWCGKTTGCKHTPQPTQAQAGAVPLTAKQMESGREAIFSTGNPYCPCDSKTFRKVAEWVERHHGIKGADHA